MDCRDNLLKAGKWFYVGEPTDTPEFVPGKPHTVEIVDVERTLLLQERPSEQPDLTAWFGMTSTGTFVAGRVCAARHRRPEIR